jgi:hypothetical protein
VAKNLRTIIREAEENVGSKNVNQVLDCLWVMENAMRHFFILAEGQKGTLSEVNEYYKEAARLAALVAPYRHPRLSAVKLAGAPNAVAAFKPDATLDELREELTKRVLELAQSGLINIDLAALPRPEPEGGISPVILYVPYCERCQTVSPQRLSCDPAEPVNPNNTVTFRDDGTTDELRPIRGSCRAEMSRTV